MAKKTYSRIKDKYFHLTLYLSLMETNSTLNKRIQGFAGFNCHNSSAQCFGPQQEPNLNYFLIGKILSIDLQYLGSGCGSVG